jgi:hypothetical protein
MTAATVTEVDRVTVVERATTDRRPGDRQAVVLLQVFVIALFLFPSDTVIKAVGAAGFAAFFVAIVALGGWLTSTFLGLHDPLEQRHPTRAALVGLWLVSLVSFALMHRSQVSGTEELAADRWLMQLAGMTGVALLAAECLTSLESIKKVLRVLVWGGAFCGIVAGLQFWTNIDPALNLRTLLPGFSVNIGDPDIIFRGALKRVTGTAIDPIELGVVAGMLLPIALYLVLYDRDRRPWKRWVPMACLAVAAAASVSRSAVLAIVVGIGLFVVLLPVTRRLPILLALPVALVGVFAAAPGLIGTLTRYSTLGTSDPSISHRTDSYAYVEQLVHAAPWFGTGGGTYIPPPLHILDNEYLNTSIELGLVGLVALVFFFGLPLATALVARQRSADAEVRALCGALAGAAAVAMVCSAAFDSFSFPMFSYVDALIFGLCGACWLLVARARAEPTDVTSLSQRPALVPKQRGSY